MASGGPGSRSLPVVAAIVLFLAGPMAAAAPAHETLAAGPLQLTVGWAREPAYTGVENFVEVAVADAAGTPVPDPGNGLTAAVSFGPATVVVPLVPGDRPGTVRAALLPTRAGTYSIHVTGSVGDQAVDITSTCSETTFDCVTDVAEIQFPAQDPSAGQMAERVRREAARAERARSDATSARWLALGAIVLAGGALITSSALLLRARRAGRQD